LRDQICAEFESIEREAGRVGRGIPQPRNREEEGNPDPGGGAGPDGARSSSRHVPTVRATESSINGASADVPGFTQISLPT
jgi:coproporphyrinogen III oxidase